ncbi:MAG: hypothetical protein H3C51_07740 [Rubellimicrobium sp.]|nr:hypothetical protein [Rubellimicrobium sp.]
MIRPSRLRLRPSRGERLRLAALLLGGVVGAALCVASVDALDGVEGLPGGGWRDLWRLVAGFAGTTGLLWLNRGRFGWPGWRGWMVMAGGALMVTLFAPVAVGTLVLPLYGTMFGPLALTVTFLRSPALAALWVVTLVVGHRLSMTYRRERATIFFPRAPR